MKRQIWNSEEQRFEDCHVIVIRKPFLHPYGANTVCTFAEERFWNLYSIFTREIQPKNNHGCWRLSRIRIVVRENLVCTWIQSTYKIFLSQRIVPRSDVSCGIAYGVKSKQSQCTYCFPPLASQRRRATAFSGSSETTHDEFRRVFLGKSLGHISAAPCLVARGISSSNACVEQCDYRQASQGPTHFYK